MIRVSYSGGRDSTALALYLRGEGHEVELVFCDTGAELPETLSFVPWFARQQGMRLHIISGPTFLQQCAYWGFILPSARMRWCTRELKIKPLEAFDPNTAKGICADEERLPGAYRPLVDAGITKGEAARIVERAGMLNPVYKWRSSCSCFCCPFQRLTDWRNMAREHPSLYALAEAWERESMANSKFTWREGTTLEQLRQADESQLRMLTDTREEACAICQW